MFNHILVLCVGNICRSPVAEALLKANLPGKTIESAGLGALVDHEADPTAAELAQRARLDLTEHRARQVTTEQLRRADLILVMSEGQRAQVRAQDPTAAGKTMLLTHWLPGKPDIPDPYKKSREAFEHVHQMLQDSVQAWLPKLK
ncbi:low molecular weight phosphotyrosine protein phosphatase [Marinobacter sp. NP-4(2019)]|uniref:low molecular weight protein-tyrosine-phosphatase n=1 Tax=Marinobacter sp. NP-4(2019) TaxID=2488665 RepID=UPI000FC3E686|nr:low molecular weight protein-tyrosine-phosphatase [Marinobacter sp. NP-4(2019)]AZT84540.1 low molecular weight phosphotyrosine protein phosphatase [Marinobacter sp. NP-4(2019)]